MKHAALLFALFFSLGSARADEINSGSYALKMSVPEIAKKDVEMVGTIKVNEKRFTFDTVDVGGDPITMQGRITEKGILMWIAKDEHDYLVTFHLTGTVGKDKESSALGKVSIFKNHEKVATGEWQLQKTSEQDGADQPATAAESKSEGKEKAKPESEGHPQ